MIQSIRKKLSGNNPSAETIRGSASNFILRILGLVAGYAFTLMVSRLFGASVLGAHTLSTTVLMLFTVVGRLGMDTHIVKTFAADRMNGRWDRIHEIYNKTLRISIWIGLVLTAMLYFSSGWIAETIFKKPHVEPFLQLISFAILPMMLRFINSECYRGFGMNKEYAYSQNVGYFIYATIILGALSLISENEFLPNIAFVVSLVVLAVSSTWMVMRKIRSHSESASNETGYAEWIRTSSPMMMAGSLLLISGWINTLILGAYRGEEELGVFAVILKVTNFGNFIILSVNGFTTPRFAQLHHAGDMEGLKKHVRLASKIIFWASLPVFAFMFICNDWLLLLFGPAFLMGSQAMLVSTAGRLVGALTGPTGNLLNMTGHQNAFRNIMIVTTAINVILCFVLIPKYGIMGSAIASSLFIITYNMACVVYIRIKLGLNSFYIPFIS